MPSNEIIQRNNGRIWSLITSRNDQKVVQYLSPSGGSFIIGTWKVGPDGKKYVNLYDPRSMDETAAEAIRDFNWSSSGVEYYNPSDPITGGGDDPGGDTPGGTPGGGPQPGGPPGSRRYPFPNPDDIRDFDDYLRELYNSQTYAWDETQSRWNEAKTGYRSRYTTDMDQMYGLQNQQTNRQYNKLQARAMDNMQKRGLTGTTVAPTMRQGIERNRGYDLNMNQYNTLMERDKRKKQYLDFLGQRQNIQPVSNYLAQLGSQAGYYLNEGNL